MSEIEAILNQEYENFLKIDSKMSEKREILINSNLNKLQDVDIEIIELSSIIKNLEDKKNKLLENIKYQNNKDYNNILSKQNKLKDLAKKIYKKNKINEELIRHSIKINQSTINMIANSSISNTSSYDKTGKFKNNHTNVGISSVIQDV